jgi:hypothetical protein
VRVSGIVPEGFGVCNYDYDGNETLGGQKLTSAVCGNGGTGIDLI